MSIVPINQLNPYQDCWTIKVRISFKTQIRHWQNARGEGNVFSFDCIDEVNKALYVLFWRSQRKTMRVGSEGCMLLTPD
jgi:replication factor A1